MNQGRFSPVRPTASKNNHPVFQTAVAIITVTAYTGTTRNSRSGVSLFAKEKSAQKNKSPAI